MPEKMIYLNPFRRFIKPMVFAWAMFAASFSSSYLTAADSADAPPYSPDQSGAYCSTVTSIGVWAFSFGFADPGFHCQRNRNFLQQFAPGSAMTTSWGYYNAYSFNRVSVHCAGVRNEFTGQGDWPLQDAFEFAQFSNAQSCHFTVY